MINIDYSCPLPEKKLVKRFKNVFEKINAHQSATLLALPYAGRTSNLRYLLNNKAVLTKLNFNHENKTLAFVDIDKTNGNYESFMSEVIESMTHKSVPPDIFKDTYLLNRELFNNLQRLTKKGEVVLIITLNQKSLSFSTDIDRLIAQAQKSVSNFPLTILWSIDTEVYRKYVKSHPSSTFGQNLFFFPTFDKTETEYNISRILVSKSISKFDVSTNSFSITGGIAGLFHLYINTNTFNLYENELTQEILKKLKIEIEINSGFADKLATVAAKEIVFKKSNTATNYKSIKLLSEPTAQEINILNFMLENNNPVSRDEVAQVLWGKAWNTRYSDWAIDKTISRLRKKILGNEIKILTIKNFGYQLFK